MEEDDENGGAASAHDEVEEEEDEIQDVHSPLHGEEAQESSRSVSALSSPHEESAETPSSSKRPRVEVREPCL